MKIIARKSLTAKAAAMPPEYLADVQAAIIACDAEFCAMAAADYERIRTKWADYRPGLGDYVAGVIDVLTLGRGKTIAAGVAGILGMTDCGCDARQELLNRLGRHVGIG